MNPPAALRRDGLDPSAASVVGTGLHKTYRSGGVRRRATAVFDDVWFSADARELVAIAGPSGVGKSTLLYCLAGLEPVDAGEVRIEGVDITHCRRATRAQLRRTHMGFVFQEYNLVDSLIARGNIELALRMAGDRARRGNRRPVVDGVLEQVGMTGRADAYPAELSGGQQQRIAVARALVVRPPVVFADEPTGALDVHNSGIVLAGLRDLAASGSCVVVVTHDPRVADQADRVVTLGP